MKRLTTVAHRAMLEADLSRNKRKEEVDKIQLHIYYKDI